ncbi:PPC domain-containing protein [Humisphaera borealis]|uniref:PPC domain-containing protein n=1 Tax=Humisphaera borealis TaxID=2807512 RepID=A0A7M2WRF5_9BACT|nr:PPC domain-containing protein [Humisphaera borealis]QOV88135.1 PPC domain-containing protein [Humisphaera borealis]
MLRSVSVAVVSLFIASSALAQLPAARISAVVPPGGKSGTTFDVKIEGIDLDDIAELRFSHPGINAKKSEADGKSKTGTFTVTLGNDVPVGVYDCRAIGRFGISNPRGFFVHDRQTAAGAKAGNTPDAAAKLPPNAYAAGQCSANAFDFWSFTAAKGQRVMIECVAKEIDSKLSPNLAVDDATGRELDRSRRNGFIDFTAPADGDYLIRVSDALYRGGNEFNYLLAASAAPRLSHVFPPSSKPGGKTTFTLFGRNLPGGKKSELLAADGKPLEQIQVDIDLPIEPAAGQRLQSAGMVAPSSAALSGFAYRLKSDYGTSNAVPILYVGTKPEVETEAIETGKRNDLPENAQKLSLPAEVAGRFYPRNDRDYYTFDAKKGDVYFVSIVCDRLDQPAAPLVVVQKVTKDDKGEKLADVLTSPEDESNPGTPAFRTSTRDFAMKWEVKEDGAYRLLARDRFSLSRDDGALRYHLSIRKPAPDFQLAASPVSAAASETAVWNPVLRKGGTAVLRVNLFRQDDFESDVTVSVVGLPPDVKCDQVTISGKESVGVLLLSATNDTKPWAGRIGVVATAKTDTGELKREARAGAVVAGSNADPKANNNNNLDMIVARVVSDLAIAVCDEAEPLTLTTADDKVYEVVSGEKLSIPLKLSKAGEIKAALKLKAFGPEAFKGLKEVSIDVKADKATVELDTKQVKLPPGTHIFYLASPAQFKYERPGGDPPAKPDEKKNGKDKKKLDAKDVSTTLISAPITVRVLPAPEAEKKDKKK